MTTTEPRFWKVLQTSSQQASLKVQASSGTTELGIFPAPTSLSIQKFQAKNAAMPCALVHNGAE